MSKITFREYSTTDNTFVTEGLCEIETIENESDTSLQLIDNFKETVSEYLSKINIQPSTLTIIAEINNRPCGFAMGIVEIQNSPFTTFSTHGLIQAIWVKPTLYRQGIGTALVRELLSSFAEFEVPYCDIAYHPKNKIAQQFWNNLGFIDAQITARKFLN